MLLVVCLVAILATACDSIDEFVEERTSESTPVASATRTAIPEGTTAAGPHNLTEVPTPKAGPTASGLVLPVSIAAVPVDLPEYDRGTWRHWIDEDSDCQNARQEVLIAESSVEVTYESEDECRVATGSWLGPYTGKTVSSPSELDIDHLVPLGNAHRSGAWSWDRERKREFANHLGYEDHLIATTSSANRSKGSKGPENWRPELEGYWCSYATAWVAVKNAWGLTATEAEYTALAEMLSTCEIPVLLEPGSGAPLPMPTATMAPTLPAGLRYDPFGPDRNCGDFDTYQEALTFFLAAGGPDVDRHRLDVNGDGEPCETLPGGPSAKESPDPSSSMSALYARFPTPSLEEETNCPPATSLGTLGGQGAAEQTSTASDSDCPLPPTPIPEPHATSTPAPHPTVSPTLVPTPTPTPTPEPTPEPAPEEPFEDRDCGDFVDWKDAQDFFLAEGGPDEDPHGLDRDGNGVACQSLPGSPRNERELPTPSPSPSPTAAPEAQPTEEPPAHPDLLFDPSGPDRDCGDFPSWWKAQNFYLAAGGAGQDPHSLDHNGDGIACQSLDGAPANDPQAPYSGSASSDESSGGFVDHDCGEFATWREAQDFFESEGGPEEDPHQLDHNNDGMACESLDGAPADDAQEPDSGSASSDESSGGFVDRDCGDFATWREAQEFFESEGGPEEDPHQLDHNSDGVACQSLDGAPADDAQEPDSGSASSDESSGGFVDRDCGDFATWREAQEFFESEGGPEEDPHHLDHDSDGVACQSLDGAPADDAQAPDSGSAYSDDSSGGFVDHDCGDFATWREAQDFFESEGGPEEDPHQLDHNNDGVACESLDGAPADDAQAPDSGSESSDDSSDEFVDHDCGDFATWREAQDFFESEGGPEEDPHHLDHNNDGVACESLDGAPADDAQEPDSGSASSDDSSGGFVDHDCGDFATWREAQDFFESEGGPEEDPHHLDHNNDGVACESLEGAPADDPQASNSGSASSDESGDEFVDRNCGDFDTWREAQDFFESEGGPEEDPHGLDGNNDGVACESLPGAPEDNS